MISLKVEKMDENEQSNIEKEGTYLVIPIRKYDVEIQIQGKKNLTQYEKGMLLYIYEEQSLDKILNVFNLPNSLNQEILIRLLYMNLIKIDFHNQKIEIFLLISH